MHTWVTGFSASIFSGNCAFVTRKVDIRRRCSSFTNVLISGYIIGSPTRDRAQCLGARPSINRSILTPSWTDSWVNYKFTVYKYNKPQYFFLIGTGYPRTKSRLIPWVHRHSARSLINHNSKKHCFKLQTHMLPTNPLWWMQDILW